MVESDECSRVSIKTKTDILNNIIIIINTIMTIIITITRGVGGEGYAEDEEEESEETEGRRKRRRRTRWKMRRVRMGARPRCETNQKTSNRKVREMLDQSLSSYF